MSESQSKVDPNKSSATATSKRWWLAQKVPVGVSSLDDWPNDTDTDTVARMTDHQVVAGDSPWRERGHLNVLNMFCLWPRMGNGKMMDCTKRKKRMGWRWRRKGGIEAEE